MLLLPTLLVIGGQTLLDRDQLTVKVLLSNNRSLVLDLEDYLVGVVAAEMPATFELEALKAQAVAARSYLLSKMQGKGSSQVTITNNINLDQAWMPKKELLKQWDDLQYWFKVLEAVNSTKGEFLTHRGQVITAVYHSASGSRTASAANVWGDKVAYLKSVENPYETASPYNNYIQEFSPAELQQKLRLATNQLTPAEINVLKRSMSERVLQVKIGKQLLTGQEVRKKLGLKSTNFTCQLEDGKVRFITTGYGHGVGMSQYGANGMAKEGYDYLTILQHYYSQTEVKRLTTMR
ncbi:MAG: stage II sporulation protein D [Bacillota bacterium]